MADVYVYSGAAGAGTGADWTNAYTTLGAATTAKAAGDDFWVASDHAETAASAKTITFPGTDASPNRCISVNRGGSVPPVAADILAGASVTTTGTSNITVAGYVYMRGITFNCGTGSGGASINLSTGTNGVLFYEGCTFNLVATGTAGRLNIGSLANANGTNYLSNCAASFASTSQGITLNGPGTWSNIPGSVMVTGATIPTTLITQAGFPTEFRFSGVDLSASGSGKTLVAAAATIARSSFVNCKLGASVTVAGTPSARLNRGVDLVGCGSTTDVSRNERYRYEGTLTTETTIKRTAGASDGTTAYSWKIVTTANSKRTFPFETFEGAVWNATTGSSKTLTFHCVTDNVTLQDADIWVEVEYLGSSATPVTTLVSSAPATQLTTGANLTTDTETWTTTGLATPVKQKFSVTFTPQMAGAIRWKVKVAKASTTVYVDPYPDLA